MKVQKMCIDLGNGGFKGALVRVKTPYAPAVLNSDGSVQTPEQPEVREIVTAYLPAKVGVGNTNMGLLHDLPGLERAARREAKPIQIVSDDGVYLVGPHVEWYTSLIERFDPGKYTNSPELRAITRALLAQMVDGGSQDVALVVALPVEIMMAPNVKDVVKGIERWLCGEHTFTYDDKPACVRVQAVRALPQPLGAFIAWGAGLDGQWARDETDLTDATTAVLDSGFNTLDLLLVRDGRIEKRYTGGDNLGVHVAAQEIANALHARYGFRLSLLEVDTLIHRYLEEGRGTRVIAGAKVDLKPIIKQALNTFAAKTVGYVTETWGNARDFSHVLLAGGGAHALDTAIRRAIPNAQIPTDPISGAPIDPVHANAIGLAKLVQRKGVFKGLD